MQQSQIFWKWVGRVGGVVGLLGGGLAIYAFVGGRLLAFIIWVLAWVLATGAVMISRTRRGDRETERMERIEAKVDRLLAHFDVDPHLGDRDGAGPGPAAPGLPEGESPFQSRNEPEAAARESRLTGDRISGSKQGSWRGLR